MFGLLILSGKRVKPAHQSSERCLSGESFWFFPFPGLCDVGCSSNRFYFRKTSVTWPEARQYCRRKRGDLATVNDLQDLENLAGLVEDNHRVVFLGLRRQWAWSVSDSDAYREGEPAYWNWADGNERSGEACATIGPSGKWFSSSCSSQLHFFCYTGKNSHLTGFCVDGRVLCQTDNVLRKV